MNGKTINDKTTITIVEDHPVMREGLASFFTGTGRWNVVGKASTLAEARKLISSNEFNTDIILLDIQLEDGWGLDLIQQIKSISSCPVIAVYSVFDDYPHVSAALSMGVRAYINKCRNENELEKALFTALDGGIYIDNTTKFKYQTVMDILSLLTKRETEILNLVKTGFSNKQIAANLNISRRTVENILSCVYDKTGIESRLELERL